MCKVVLPQVLSRRTRRKPINFLRIFHCEEKPASANAFPLFLAALALLPVEVPTSFSHPLPILLILVVRWLCFCELLTPRARLLCSKWLRKKGARISQVYKTTQYTDCVCAWRTFFFSLPSKGILWLKEDI